MTVALMCKVVLLGDSGVGKTSILTRWMTGAYQRTTNPNVGASHECKSVVVGETPVDLLLWDTAGQEQFHALAPLYARSASVAILTASITDRRSFESLPQWAEILGSANGEVPPLVLAVNKTDLRASATITDDEVEAEFGGQFAGVFFVSALTGEGIENLFLFAAQVGHRFAVAHQAGSEPAPEASDARCC
jgi:small GTP-binding protein